MIIIQHSKETGLWLVAEFIGATLARLVECTTEDQAIHIKHVWLSTHNSG